MSSIVASSLLMYSQPFPLGLQKLLVQLPIRLSLDVIIKTNDSFHPQIMSFHLLLIEADISSVTVVYDLFNNIIKAIQIIFMKRVLPLLCMLVLIAAEINNFDYSSHGDDWAQDNPDSWSECDTTNEKLIQQSPIEISEGAAKAVPSFLFSNFNPADATLTLLNTTVYLKATSFGELYTRTVAGDVVVMKATEMRFRSHAEHKFQGKDFYDLEMQIFFLEAYPSSRNERMAVSIMFEVAEGASSPLLKAIKEGKDQQKLKLNVGEFLSNQQPFDFYYYMGSLTLPPCKDGKLDWIVSKKVFKMSQQERDYFWGLFYNKEMNMDGNYRRIQPPRGNKVDFYHFSSL